MTNLNKEIKALEKAFEAFIYKKTELQFRVFQKEMAHLNVYNTAESMIIERKIIPTIDLVESFFTHSLKKYSSPGPSPETDFRYELKYYIGHFSSALSNLAVKDRKKDIINLRVGNFEKQINNLGCFLRNVNVKINGDVGNRTGMSMKSGNLIIEGNVGNYLGTRMNNGKIEIHGNVGDYFGDSMHGGEIEIFGNAGDVGGHNMKNGLIKVHGKAGGGIGTFMDDGVIHLDVGCEDVSSARWGGKIYRKGIRVRQKIFEGPRYFEDFIKTLNKKGN